MKTEVLYYFGVLNLQKRFKRVLSNDDSDGDQEMDERDERDNIANQLFDGDRDDVSIKSLMCNRIKSVAFCLVFLTNSRFSLLFLANYRCAG